MTDTMRFDGSHSGYIGYRLYRVVYTRRGKAVRIISLRIASEREERKYAAT